MAAGDHSSGTPRHRRGPVTPLIVVATTVPLAVTGAALTGARLAGSPLAFPCPMDDLFGLACPVCGCWRAATAMASGDVAGIADQWSAALVVGAVTIAASSSVLSGLRRRLPPVGFARTMLFAIAATMAINLIVQLVRITS